MKTLFVPTKLTVALLLFLYVQPSVAATTHDDKCQTGPNFSVSSIACSITTVTSGSALAVGVYWNDATGTLSSVTLSTCTGTVTLYNNGQADGTAKGSTGAVFNVGVGGNCTITANFSEVVDDSKIWVHEIGGLGNGTVAGNLADTDTFRSASCTDCIPDVAGQLAITPAQNGAYFFGLAISSGTAPITPGTDFTDGATDDSRGTAEYYIQPTAASHATTFSRSDATGSTHVAFALVLQPEGGVSSSGGPVRWRKRAR